MQRTLWIVMLLPLCASAVPFPVESQATASGVEQVVVATGAPIPSGKRAMVLVRRNKIPHEVVVLAPTATAEDLVASMQTLRALEVSLPPQGLQRDIRAFPTRFVPRADWEARHKGRYMKYLADVRHASLRNIPGLGALRAIDLSRSRRGDVLEY